MKLFWVIAMTVVAIGVGLLCTFPRPPTNNHEMFSTYQSVAERIRSEQKTPFPVMSFNVRLDCEEKDPNNHFTKRVSRLQHVFQDWAPLLVGVQEPFQGQIMDLMRHIPPTYRVVGYNREGQGHEYDQLGHPSRLRDYQTALFYRSDTLNLVHEDHIWLSDTPTVEGSRHPSSRGVRTATMGRFQVEKEYFGDVESQAPSHVLAFSTHLDVWSEEGRQYQAQQLLRFIEEKHQQYPSDPILLFGDFNAVPGHKTHQILTSSLQDAWDMCEQADSVSCQTNSFGITYHHYWGSFSNTYFMRAIQYVLHTLHGSGLFILMDGWNGVPSFSQLKAQLDHNWMERLWDAVPTSVNRLHVDWILFRSEAPMVPRFVHVVDIASPEYSSDHFPVFALFSI